MEANTPMNAGENRFVQPGDIVGYRYIIRSEAGQVLAASTEVVHYLHGGTVTQPRELAAQMEGRHQGESFTATLSQQEALGASREVRRITLPRSRFPTLVELTPGKRVNAATAEGEAISVWVVQSTEQEVLLDFDHPLAGRTLLFEVSIISIRVATEAEQESGKPAAMQWRVAQDQVCRELLELRESVELRFSKAERGGGSLEELGAQLSGDDTLEQSEAALLERLDALVTRVRLGGGYDHRPALAALVHELDRHDGADGEKISLRRNHVSQEE